MAGEKVELSPAGSFAGQDVRNPIPGQEQPRITRGGEGGGFMARAGASIKLTQEGKVGFLNKTFGPGNVFTDREGEIFIRDPNDPSRFIPFDESGFSVKDITADVAGPAMQVAPMLAASPTVVGQAAAGAVGAAARQGVSALLPGDEGLSLPERALDVGIAAGTAAASQGVVNAGAKVFDTVRNFMSTRAVKATQTPIARKGRRLTEETGIPLTVGEETGSRAILTAESIARQNIATVDEFFAFHQNQLRTSLDKLRGALDDISPVKGSFTVGTRITGAFDDATTQALAMRRNQATVDFGEVARLTNGRGVLTPSALSDEIDKVIRQFNIPGAGDAAQSIVNKARQLKKTLLKPDSQTGEIDRLTAEQTNRLLQIYTRAQGGTGVIFKDMDKAQSKLIAGRLKDALLQDLDETVTAGGFQGEALSALKAARDNYRLNSAAIKEIGDSVLARLIGNRTTSPEAIAEKVATKLKPSEIADVMQVVERIDPGAANAIRRSMIETAIDAARTAPSQTNIGAVKFSSSQFLSNLPSLEHMKAAGFTRPEIVEIGRVSKTLERISDRALQGSQTAPMMIAADILRGVFTLNLSAIGRTGSAILLPKHIARLTLTPEGRQALINVAETPAGAKKAGATLMAFIGTVGAEEVMEGGEVQPFPEGALIEP